MLKKRNILVILCDQLRKDFLPLYGAKAIKTPNIDRISQMGVVFDRAITVSTVCAPARASMMTGRYVSDHQVWTNDIPFRPGMDTIACCMNDLDYNTGCFGKLHHFPSDDSKGFKTSYQMEAGRLKEKEPYFAWLKERHPEIDGIFNYDEDGFTFNFPAEDYYEHYLADRAIEFMENSEEQPFFAWLSFHGPHTPYDPPKEVSGTVDESKIPALVQDDVHSMPELPQYRSAQAYDRNEKPEVRHKKRRAYLEMIVEIDLQIGRVLDALEKNGILENTTIIFSSDHGDELGDHLLDSKGPFPYSAQLEIPQIIANHPQIPQDGRSDILCSNLDLPGTVLDIAEADKGIGYSRSLIGMLNKAPVREVNYSEFCDSIKTVENRQYRFSYYPFAGEKQLFDLQADPDCLRNLAGKKEFAEEENRMLAHLLDFGIIARGVRIEAQDLTPKTRLGLEKKNPAFLDDYEICFPATAYAQEHIDNLGLDGDYNDFVIGEKIKRQYGLTRHQVEQQKKGEAVDGGFPLFPHHK